MTLRAAMIRLLWFDLVSALIAAALLPLGFRYREPSFVFSVVVLVVGFAFGAHAAIVRTQSSALRAAIVVGSMCVWLICVYFVMIYWLNTFGS